MRTPQNIRIPVSDISERRIEEIAHDYYQRYVDYGVCHAAQWLRDNLKDEDVPTFLDIQQSVAKKYGLK